MSIKARLVDSSGDLTGVASNPLPQHKIPRVDIQRIHKSIAQPGGKCEDDGTYYYYVDMTLYDYHGFQWDITAGSGSVTLTFEASCGHNELTEPASLDAYDWDDVTNDLFGVASWTTDDLAVIDTIFPVHWLRIKAVHNTGAADDSSLTLWMVRR